MKNKKLIATVASLCLVLVAVVAAVIGVLAAANQQVSNKIKVGYIARANVTATVIINGKTEHGSYADYSSAVPQTAKAVFNTTDESTKANLEFAYQSPLALSEVNNKVERFALYQFSFKNDNSTHGLNVSMTYVETETTDASQNVQLYWVRSAVPTFDPTSMLKYNQNGVLITSGEGATSVTGAFALSSGAADVYKDAETNAAIAHGATAYIYLVVAVVDLNADAGFDMSGADGAKSLTFDLSGYKVTA